MRLAPRSAFIVILMLAASSTALAQIDTSPLPATTQLAFPNLQWTGWQPVSEAGLPQPLRPLVLTHAGDGTNRVFVATQQGVIHVFPNDQSAQQTTVFLDHRPKTVDFKEKEFEEGLLGLAFHPKYKENGQFFIYYTTNDAPHVSVISRFRVSANDPNKADPKSEEEIMRIPQPFWNHNGGTLVFGPDGYLYIGMGDGGSANDPMKNGQNLQTLLGKILRIDVDHKDQDKNYAIPPDNPFVNHAGVRPEIWAYGIRNIWRMAFDPQTGNLWAADVGQDLWEEIDIIQKGGNYGWSLREGLHPFGPSGSGPRPELVEPIFEYHHNVGKSITGGLVYRGTRLPALTGHYLYADFVSGLIWALKYDEATGRVTANHPIPGEKLAALSFGEDENRDAYILIVSPTGKGIYRFEQK
jgi:glucose/arabinose dehydrogenase